MLHTLFPPTGPPIGPPSTYPDVFMDTDLVGEKKPFYGGLFFYYCALEGLKDSFACYVCSFNKQTPLIYDDPIKCPVRERSRTDKCKLLWRFID